MKKKYKKLMLFLSLCLSLFIGLTVSSHAYYVNNDGNLVSDNLINNELDFDVENQTFNSYYIAHVYTLNDYITQNGSYSFSISFEQSIENNCAIELRRNDVFINASLNGNFTGLLSISDINVDLTYTYSIRVFATYQSGATKSIKFYNSMLNSGSSVLAYEPYGTYYSQTNYNEYGGNRYSVGFSDALQYDSVSPVSMENLSECTYFVNGANGSSSGWFERTFILNGSLVDTSLASEDDGFNTSYGLFSGSQDFVDFVLDDYGIHLTSETPSELGQESYIEFVLSRAYSSDNFSCTLGLAFTHLDCFDSSGSLVYSFANDNSSIFNRNYVLSNVPLSNISVFKLYFNQDIVLDESPVFLNISPLESAFNSGYLKGLSDNSINYEYGKQKFKEGYDLGKSDAQNSSVVANSNFQKLIWTIGATPFESFKTIWDVDVMGLNISGIILGGLMALLVLYLIKKIWK